MYSVEQYQMLDDAKPLLKKYEKRIDKIAKEVTGLSDFEAVTVAMLCDNSEKVAMRYAKAKNLSDTSYSEVVGPFVRHALNIVSTMYTTFDLKDLISIQPLRQKIGALYFLNYTYASDKGKVKAGDTMFSARSKPVRTGNYSSQSVIGENLTLTYGTASTASLKYFPIASIGTAEIKIVITGGSAAGTYTYLSTVGNVFNLQKNGGGSTAATLNTITGLFSIAGNVTAGVTSVVADYVWNSEKYSTGSPVPRVSISVEEHLIRARRRQLLFDVSLDTTFDFDQQFGRDMNAELESSIIQEMQNEMAFLVLDRLFNEATGNGANTYTFDLSVPSGGMDLYQHAQQLFKFFATMSTHIFQNLGRGRGNKIVCGDRLYEFLSVLPNTVWVAEPVPDGARGPYKAGRLLNKYDVYHNQGMGRNDFMMMYKGTDWWESPFYVGVYLPLMSSKFMMFPDMHGEQGYISMEANEYLFPQHVVVGTVTESTGS